MQTVIAGIVLAFIASLNSWATRKALRDPLSTRGQKAAQTAIVWLFPIIGGLLVIRLLGEQRQPPSGKYKEPTDPGDDHGLSARPDWNAGASRHESASPSNDAHFLG